MSWHFSQALVDEYSVDTCSDGELSAQLRLSRTMRLFSSSAKMMEFCRRSPSGMTCEHLTEEFGEAVLMSFLEDFPARHIPQRLQEKTLLTISGRKCDGSWQMSLPGTCLPRTSPSAQLMEQQTTSSRWVTLSDAQRFRRETWVLTTFGKDTGYLHTPTCTANYASPSMQKWPACREYVRVFGRPTPTNHEWLMGWHIGWTDLQPLETVRFQQWQQQHGDCYAMSDAIIRPSVAA